MALSPIYTAQLLPLLDQLLIDFLKGINLQDWEKQTVAPKWKVKDVALHLLDGNLRALSMLRDGHFETPNSDLNTYKELVSYLNKLNHEWIIATRRLSPKVIIDLLESSGKEYCTYIQGLNPEDQAVFSVAWAGEKESKNWFHIAREYTEKWHHQQQIRLAVSEDNTLLKKEWYYPFLNTSMRALPFHYNNIKAEEGEVVQITIVGEENMDWFLFFKDNNWHVTEDNVKSPGTNIRINKDLAWRIFTKGIDIEDAISNSIIEGDHFLGRRFFETTAVMG